MTHKVLIAGVGMTPFTALGSGNAAELTKSAVSLALADTGLDLDLIDQTFFASVHSGSGIGERLMAPLGLTGISLINVRDGCVSGHSAFHLARQSLLSGETECVLVVGCEAMPAGISSRAFFDLGERAGKPQDLTVENHKALEQLERRQHPAELFAAQSSHLLTGLGVSEATFEQVLMGARTQARHNPYALFNHLDEVDTWLAPYLSAPASGAAALILCTPTFVRRYGLRADIACLVSLQGGDTDADQESHSALDALGRAATRRLSTRAYELASLGPEDIDLVELHDQSVGDYLINSSALGFCREDQLAAFAQGRHNGADGGVAVCPSGGLLGRGHAPGATGIAQLVELVWQLRGVAGSRQLTRARTALQHGTALGRAVSLNILQRMS
ncbi:thiolase C-terminal domain-containing protein [Pseudomonas paeninsulae]|uniref:thiolase C-terminal domain-containing protein n=1 Tax=Pseudomonas paeninsulae TaxID=3110772 RepID=UPI002D78FD38|nr:beta-ketoacyl synthase N-terminal-like domain-containing protein [Pseudomonas sp. IT1137]